MTSTFILAAAGVPVMLLPGYAGRLAVKLWAASNTATDYIRISDDPGKVQSVMGSVLLYSGMDLDLEAVHTGPIWGYFGEGTGPITVHVMAVTE